MPSAKSSVISHQPLALEAPDWAVLREMVPETAAKHLRSILASLDATEKQLFAMRGMCAMLIEERELYRWVVDEEVGDYYTSFDRFLKQEFPNSWSYIRDALRTVKELKETPFEDLLQIRRCNLEQLKKVSTSVRLLPEVVKAAKTLPEKEFINYANREFDQHLEAKAPIVMAPEGDVQEFEQAIAMAMACEECKTRAEAIRAISISYIQDHEAAYDHIGEEETA